jgi:hypothetical protein
MAISRGDDGSKKEDNGSVDGHFVVRFLDNTIVSECFLVDCNFYDINYSGSSYNISHSFKNPDVLCVHHSW